MTLNPYEIEDKRCALIIRTLLSIIEEHNKEIEALKAENQKLRDEIKIGPRKQYVADKLVELVNKHLSDQIPVFVIGGLNFYKEALLKQFGVLKDFPRTGKRGRSKKPKIVPFDDLRYAQVVKTRVNGVLEKVEKKIIFGKDIEQKEISTTLLERQNLTFRQDNNRVSRKTIGFSKVKE